MENRSANSIGRWILVVAAWFAWPWVAQGDDLDRKPIEYSRGQGDNPISRLQQQLSEEVASWEEKPGFGFLPDLLRALDISASSQTLVFFKTSFSAQSDSAGDAASSLLQR